MSSNKVSTTRVRRYRRWSIWLALPCALLGVWLFITVNPWQPAILGGTEGVVELSWEKTIVSLFLTFAGVVLSAVYNEALSRKELIRYREFFGKAFRTPGFISGLAAAPISFAVLLQSLSGVEMPALIFLSLQHGFSASSILAAALNSTTNSRASN